MKISGDWIHHPGTQALCNAISAAGFQAFLVGGCVRNSLIGRAVADIDIASDATPENVTELAVRAGFRVIPTGFDHGTVTVIAKGLAHEVTTFRRDIDTDGRHAKVVFSNDISEDAARRDFTMNALYAKADGTIVDPLGGLPDVIAGRVRFVGTAEARIREDYLRILRFFRFHALYGDPDGGIDAEGLAACAANAEGIAGLSRERIGAEMRKLLSARDPSVAIASMAQAGVLSRILPGADPRFLSLLVHFEMGGASRWQSRLALIGGEEPGGHLRLSNQETVTITAIRHEVGGTLSPAALAWTHGTEIARDVVLNRAAIFETAPPQNWQSEIERGAAAKPPVTAVDLMPGLQGPALGKKLREIEVRWLASDLHLSKSELLA